MPTETLTWRINTPTLLREILCNPSTSILGKPLQILGEKLHQVAERAIQLDDPRLNILMLELTLYDIEGGSKAMPDPSLISRAIEAQMERMVQPARDLQ